MLRMTEYEDKATQLEICLEGNVTEESSDEGDGGFETDSPALNSNYTAEDTKYSPSQVKEQLETACISKLNTL